MALRALAPRELFRTPSCSVDGTRGPQALYPAASGLALEAPLARRLCRARGLALPGHVRGRFDELVQAFDRLGPVELEAAMRLGFDDRNALARDPVILPPEQAFLY